MPTSVLASRVLQAVLGPNFLRNPLYVVDVLIVSVSLSLELYLYGNASAELAGTIAFARVWRFVRIGHGLSTAQHESSLAEFEKIEDHVREVEEELRRLRSRHR